MALVIAHLSDIHIKTDGDKILSRVEPLANAIIAETNGFARDLVLLFSGDLVQSGQLAEFHIAEKLVEAIHNEARKHENIDHQYTLIIPGNHDCDLSGDLASREILLNSLSPKRRDLQFLRRSLHRFQHFSHFHRQWLRPAGPLKGRRHSTALSIL